MKLGNTPAVFVILIGAFALAYFLYSFLSSEGGQMFILSLGNQGVILGMPYGMTAEEWHAFVGTGSEGEGEGEPRDIGREPLLGTQTTTTALVAITSSTTTSTSSTTTITSSSTTASMTTTSTTTTTPPEPTFKGSSFACNAITDGYSCGFNYENNLGENAVVVFLYTNTDGDVVNSPAPVAPQGSGIVSSNFYCANRPAGNYYVSWKAYRQSDTLLSNPVTWSKSTEKQLITCNAV